MSAQRYNLIRTPQQAWDAYTRLVRAQITEPEIVGDHDYRDALKRAHARFVRIWMDDQ